MNLLLKLLSKKTCPIITVVVGYKKEQFFYLEEKFGVEIVVNEDYYRYNNSSTLMCVLDKLSDTYICSSDNYFMDNVFLGEPSHAYYAAVYAAGETEFVSLASVTYFPSFEPQSSVPQFKSKRILSRSFGSRIRTLQSLD